MNNNAGRAVCLEKFLDGLFQDPNSNCRLNNGYLVRLSCDYYLIRFFQEP